MINKSFKTSAWVFAVLGILSLQECQETAQQSKSIVDFVNPLIGADSDFSLYNGNTYPAIATPWGMNFWTPMTAKIGDVCSYKYHDKTIRGIKQTHQPMD